MIKYFSLFSGIGAFEAALDNLGIDYELVGYSEIDKYASKAYSAIHGVSESMNYGDITKIDEKKLPKGIDLISYGFPCQDISLAGKQKGLFNEDGSQTRSGLFFDALRIIEETQPKVAIAENVKNLVGKKFKEQFEIVLDSLKQAGYNNYWKVLNSKDFGIPQNRERVFIVSIRKDVDTGVFEFPEGYPLDKRLKDLLEDEVDEKFYISNTNVDKLLQNVSEPTGCQVQNKGREFVKTTDISGTLLARDYKGLPNTPATAVIEPVRLGNIYGENCGTGFAGNVWDKEAISPTLMTMQGGNRQPMIVVKTNNSKGYDWVDTIGEFECSVCGTHSEYVSKFCPNCGAKMVTSEPRSIVKVPLKRGYSIDVQKEDEDIAPEIDVIGNYSKSEYLATQIVNKNGIAPTVRENHGQVTAIAEPFIVASRGSNPENPSDRTTGSPLQQRLEPNSQGICNTLTTVHKDNLVVEPPQLRIRKLTPKECFRLQGFSDESYEKAASVCSNTQLYKQAGNSITVDVLEELFCMMFDEEGEFYI